MVMEKIVQTAGRNALGEFAPEFAHYNDDVLFGENWNNRDIVDPFEYLNSLDKTRFSGIRQVDLCNIARNDHSALTSETGKEHLYLF